MKFNRGLLVVLFVSLFFTSCALFGGTHEKCSAYTENIQPNDHQDMTPVAERGEVQEI